MCYLCYFRDFDRNYARALPPAKFMRTFYGLFWKVNGVDALVFAVTTQTTEDGDLYVEYMDSGKSALRVPMRGACRLRLKGHLLSNNLFRP